MVNKVCEYSITGELHEYSYELNVWLSKCVLSTTVIQLTIGTRLKEVWDPQTKKCCITSKNNKILIILNHFIRNSDKNKIQIPNTFLKDLKCSYYLVEGDPSADSATEHQVPDLQGPSQHPCYDHPVVADLEVSGESMLLQQRPGPLQASECPNRQIPSVHSWDHLPRILIWDCQVAEKREHSIIYHKYIMSCSFLLHTSEKWHST